MALDYAMNTDLRRLPEDDLIGQGPTVSRALAIYSEALVASSSTDADASLPVDTSRVNGATLIRLAEAAVDYGEFDQAVSAIEAYEREDPPKDQYYVRSLFVRSVLKSRASNDLSGAFKIGVVREAIASILQGLAIATEGGTSGDAKAYAFLVYNASVHHWSAVRPFLRTGARQHAIPSLTRVIECLTKAEDPDVRWRARHFLALATCHADTGDLAKAATQAGLAQDLLTALEPTVPGSFDAALIEEALRLRLHYSALLEPQAAADGGLDAKLGPLVKQASKADAAGQPNVRPGIFVTLQPILSASAPGQLPGSSAALGYSYIIGSETNKSSLAPSTTTKRSVASNQMSIRTKLADLLRQLRPASGHDIDWHKAEADAGKVNADQPDFKAMQKAKEIEARRGAAASATVKAADGNASSSVEESLSAVSAKRAKDLDLVALIAQAALQNGCIDVAYACIRALTADKSTSPAAAILTDAIDAQLLVAGLSVEDAHMTLGHFIEIPADILAAFASLQKANAEAAKAAATAAPDASRGKTPAKGVEESKDDPKNAPPLKLIRTRRQSIALQASVSFVPRRSALGRALMLPSHIRYADGFPVLQVSEVEALQQYRRIQACKLLKRALGNAVALGDSFYMELCATLAWNLSLPLLKGSTRKAIHATLAAAADALHGIDSSLIALRVRLHLECCRLERALDMLAPAAVSARRAMALDYGGARLDPAYGHTAADRAGLLPMPPMSDGSAFTSPKSGSSCDVRVLSTQRPLDRLIIPEARQVDVKSRAYDDPEHAADAAFIALEQAKAASDGSASLALLKKACKFLDFAADTPLPAAVAYQRHRSPSVFSIWTETTAVVRIAGMASVSEETAAADSSSRSKAAVPPSSAMKSSRPGSVVGSAVGSLPDTPHPGAVVGVLAARYPSGEAGGAQTVQLHKLWLDVAEAAGRIGAWDVVTRACHVLRGCTWDPLQSRDMVLGQAKADILLAEAAEGLVKRFGMGHGGVGSASPGWRESVAQAVDVAIAQQQRRAKVASILLKTGAKVLGAGAGAVTIPGTGAGAGTRPNTSVEERKKGDEDLRLGLGSSASVDSSPWWEMDVRHMGPGAYEEGNIPDSTDEKVSTARGSARGSTATGGDQAPPPAVTEGSGPGQSLVQSGVFKRPPPSVEEHEQDGRRVDGAGHLVQPASIQPNAANQGALARGPPRQYVPGETGHAPGFKPLPSDPQAMGLIVPGSPPALLALKVRAITALSRAARRGVGVRAAWVVETAALRLWNAHVHVWQANEYGAAILPQLPAAVTDVLNCLAAVGTTRGDIVAKLTNVLCRYHEESARAALVDEALGIASAGHPYFSVGGAVLADFAPDPDATPEVEGEGSAQVDLGVTEEDFSALLSSVCAHSSPSSGMCLDLASSCAGAILGLPGSLVRPSARRQLIGLRARVRLMQSRGASIPGLLTGHVRPPAPSGTGKEKDAPSSQSGVDAVLGGLEADVEGGGACPELARTLALLAVQAHAGLAFADKVSAFRSALACMEKVPAELEAALAQSSGSAPAPGAVAKPGTAGAPGKPPAKDAGKGGGTGKDVPTCPLRMDTATWGKGDASLPMVHALGFEAEAEVAAAVGTRGSEAGARAQSEAIRRENTVLTAELWARLAQAGAYLAELSADPANTSSGGGGAERGATPAGGKGAPAVAVPQDDAAVVGEADASLLIDAQRAAACSLALVPGSPLRLDELGSLYGLKGHGPDAYGLPLGPSIVKTLAPTQEVVDVHVGTVPFTHRFASGPGLAVIDGAGAGGFGSAFKWWAVGELAWAQAVGMLIKPEQSRSEQDNLRRIAIEHALSAATWASRLHDAPLLYASAMVAWNLGLPLALSAITRPQLLVQVQTLLGLMAGAGPGMATHDAYLLRSELYRLVLGCYADETHWTDGLRSAEEAFAALPAAYHDRLWGPRLLFQSKLGVDCTTALESLKSRSPLLQARLWVSLARMASLPLDQAGAYAGAFSLLSGMFTRAFVLADYAEWLAANHFPIQDVKDALLSAADIVLSVDTSNISSDGNSGGGGDGASAARSSTHGGGAGRRVGGDTSTAAGQSMGAKSSALGPAYSLPPPTIQGSQQSLASGGGRRKSSMGSVATGTRAGGKGGGGGEQDAAADWPAALDVSHLDLLVRIFSQLALVAENGCERVSYALSAVHYTTRMFEMSARTANTIAAEAEFARLSASEQALLQPQLGVWIAQHVQNGAHSVPACGDVGGWVRWWVGVCTEMPALEAKAALQAAVPTPATIATTGKLPTGRGGDKSQSMPLPAPQLTTAQIDAAGYIALRDALGKVPHAHASSAISRVSIRHPAITLSTLAWLAEVLIKAGHAAAAAPVLAAQHMVAADVLDTDPPCTPAEYAALAASAVWADACNQRAPALALLSALGPFLSLSETQARAFEGEVLLRESALLRQDQNEAPGGGSRGAGGQFMAALAAKRMRAALKGGDVIAGLRSVHRTVLPAPLVHRSWIHLARLAADMGLARGARLLLLEASRHAVSHRDYDAQWAAQAVSARIAAAEGDGKAAVSLCLAATKEARSGSSSTWLDILTLLVTTLLRHSRANDARILLQAALSSVDAVTNPPTVDVPMLSAAQMAALRQKTDGQADAAAREAARQRHLVQHKDKGAANVEAESRPVNIKDSIAALLEVVPRPIHHPAVGPDLDALEAAICVRMMLADVHAKAAVNARRAGLPWMSDWLAADALFAEAASASRRHGLDTDSALLVHALHAHACAILSCPGASPDGFPFDPSSDYEFTSVGGGEDMVSVYRASTPARRARLLYLGLACKLLHEANDACGFWASATDAPGLPADWVSPASRLAVRVRLDLAHADGVCGEEETAAALASERSMLSGLGADPVSLYLLRADADGVGKEVISLASTSPARHRVALEAVAAALAGMPLSAVRQRAVLDVAYACALHGVLTGEAVSLPFDCEPSTAAGGLGMLSQRGLVSLTRLLWDIQGEKIAAPALADLRLSAAAAGTKNAVSAKPATPAGAVKPAPGSKPGTPGGVGATGVGAPVKAINTEAMPLPLSPGPYEAGGAVDAVANIAVMPAPALSPVVPTALRALYKRVISHLQAAVASAAAAGEWSAVGRASAALVENYACLAPTRAALSLAMYQSCEVVASLRHTFEMAAGQANRQVVHMRLAEQLRETWLHSDAQPMHSAAQSYLAGSSLAHRMLHPGLPAEEVLGSLPAGTRLLLLQRSPTGRVMYAAVLARVPGPGGVAPSTCLSSDLAFSPVPGLVGRVWRHEMSDEERAELDATCLASRTFGTDNGHMIRKQGESAGAVGDLHPDAVSSMLGAEGVAGGEAQLPRSVDVGSLIEQSRRDPAEARATALIEDMTRILSPVTSASAAGSWLNFEGLSSKDAPAVILLAEKSLDALPLEALPALAGASSITRDFSLAFLGHRLSVATAMRSFDGTTTSQASPSQAPQSGGATARAPTLASADATPWYAREPVGICHAASSGVFYVSDPLLEDLRPGVHGVDEPAALASAVQKACEGAPPRMTSLELMDALARVPAALSTSDAPERAHSPTAISLLGLLNNPAACELPDTHAQAGGGLLQAPMAATWASLRGDTGVPSPATWQGLLRMAPLRPSPEDATGALNAGSAMLYHGPGNLLEHLPPEMLAGLLAPGVRIALLAGHSGTERSARRAAVAENEKRLIQGRLELEHSWETAALLSLAGVGTVVTHAWPISATACQAVLVGTLHAALRHDMTVGEAVRYAFAPTPTVAAEAEDGERVATAPRAFAPVKTRVRYATVVYGLPHVRLVNA